MLPNQSRQPRPSSALCKCERSRFDLAAFYRYATSHVMEQKHADNRWIRSGIAALMGLLILAATLPSTGGIIEGPATGVTFSSQAV